MGQLVLSFEKVEVNYIDAIDMLLLRISYMSLCISMLVRLKLSTTISIFQLELCSRFTEEDYPVSQLPHDWQFKQI